MTRSQTPLSLEHILLGFLCQEPTHGYDLYKKINNWGGISLVWHIKQSLLYALLDKLEKDGLVTSNIVFVKSRTKRKEYQITPIGRQSFLTWATSPVCHGSNMQQEFLAKLYFVQLSDIEVGLKLIEEQKMVCEQWLSSFINCYSERTDEQHYEKMIFQFRISQTQSMIKWLDDCSCEIQGILFKYSLAGS
jgi:DNA-binding PadR family transcriptional regulator